MNKETTQLINEESIHDESKISISHPQEDMTQYKQKKWTTAAFAVGSFATGATSGIAAATAKTSIPNDENEVALIKEEIEEKTGEEISNPPAPEQAILANDEGIRYAHVNADNFNDAFAQARRQVGAGGVFEYKGKLYGTYYADEWAKMSAEEKVDYQNRVNDVAPFQPADSQVAHQAEVTEHPEATPEIIPANAEMISAEPVDNEIRVLGVEAVQNEEGQIMNIALVECEEDQALLVDVDNDGTIDVLLHDDNGDGQLQESEVHDISDAGLEVADLMQAQAIQQGDMFYASNDDMPDYINDADVIMTV